MLQFILDTKRNAAINMAIDEEIFLNLKDDAVLRVYFWDAPYTTIGYFQKNDCNAVRRFTGGLLVNHKNDLSYSFCANTQSFKYIYNQQATYKLLHSAILNALLKIGYNATFANVSRGKIAINTLCVKTIYTDDLMLDGKKIVGSCMRRRGKKILVQGSLHIKLNDKDKEIAGCEFARFMADKLNTKLLKIDISQQQLENAKKIAIDKYLNDKWNFSIR